MIDFPSTTPYVQNVHFEKIAVKHGIYQKMLRFYQKSRKNLTTAINYDKN